VIREILGNLSWGQRMVLYRLLVALFLAGMIYYAFFFPKEGDRAMQRSAEALRHATSWKAESIQDLPQVGGKYQVLQEVACPSNSRITQHQTQLVDGQTREWTIVNMTVGGTSYSYTSATDKWTLGGTGGGLPAMCQTLARGEEPESLPLSKWSRKAFASKGDRRDVGTGYCREWNIAIPRHNMGPERAYVCIGEDDNLPRIVSQYGVETRYFDWNVPIDFQAPQLDPKP